MKNQQKKQKYHETRLPACLLETRLDSIRLDSTRFDSTRLDSTEIDTTEFQIRFFGEIQWSFELQSTRDGTRALDSTAIAKETSTHGKGFNDRSTQVTNELTWSNCNPGP